jgi:hypothetical protein
MAVHGTAVDFCTKGMAIDQGVLEYTKFSTMISMSMDHGPYRYSESMLNI